MLRDLRLALRSLAKQPLFTAVAALTIAIAIGANTAIFSVVNWALLRGTPGVADPGRLATVQLTGMFGGGVSIRFGPNWQTYHAYRRGSTRTLGVAGAQGYDVNFASQGGALPERAELEVVTDNYFGVLGVRPALGRLIGPADTVAGAVPVVVLSRAMWEHAFARNPAAVGSQVTVNGHAATVVGVAGGDFSGADAFSATAIWLPVQQRAIVDPTAASITETERSAFSSLLVRLRPGVTIAAAQAEAEVLLRQDKPTFGGLSKLPTPSVTPGVGAPPEMIHQIGRTMTLLMAGVGLVLLIACANVANLFLARGAGRRREVALRRSLGATSWALARQLLAESLVVSIGAGVAGVTLALWGISLLQGIKLAQFLPSLPAVPLDGRVLSFAVAVTVLTAVLCSLPPLFKSLRADPAGMLREGGHGTTARSRVQGALVVAQVAVSFVLVVGAALFVRTVHNLRGVDVGFDPESVVGFQLDLVAQGYTPKTGGEVVERLMERLRARPGIVSVATASSVPFDGMIISSARPEGAPPPREGDPGYIATNAVSPDFFRTLGITVLRGRGLTAADASATQPVAVINETMAKKFWPGRDPIGQRLVTTADTGKVFTTIVGVSSDAKMLGPRVSPEPFYVTPDAYEHTIAHLLVRAPLQRAALVAAVREELAAIDPTLPVFNIVSIRERIDRTFAEPIAAARLTSVFGAIGLALAMIGLYAVIAFTVVQRTRELAIRVALGAMANDIRGAVVRDALRLAALGVAAGAVVTWQLARLVKGSLYGVATGDVATYTVAGVGMALLAVVASYLPARRATAVDPMLALRAE